MCATAGAAISTVGGVSPKPVWPFVLWLWAPLDLGGP